MINGWYILNYHDVNFEDSIMTRAIGGTIRPDLFYRHLEQLSQMGEFISVQEGIDFLAKGREFKKPYFSIWFDDGFAGLKNHAFTICDHFGVYPTVSMCSRFALRTEMFWRCKMSALVHLDGMRLLRSELRKSYDGVPFKIRKWSLDNFDIGLVSIVNNTYEEVTTGQFREDAYRIFLDTDDTRFLVKNGWHVTNHSAAHYPLSRQVTSEFVTSHFHECQNFLDQFDNVIHSWVIPFGYGFENYAVELGKESALFVHVGNKRNSSNNWDTKNIFRFEVAESRFVKKSFQ